MAAKPNRLGRGLDILLPEKRTDGRKTSEILEIPVDDIKRNPDQPRKNFSEKELASLAGSIKAHGVLEPVIVTSGHGGGYLLIAGERRLRAAKTAGLLKIPAIIRTASSKDRMLISMIENLQRSDLNPLELAHGAKRMAEDYSLTHDQVATELGFSRPRITNLLRILSLQDEIKEYINNGHLSESQARTLLSIDNEKERLSVARKIAVEEKLITVRDLEARKKGKKTRDPNVKDLEDKIAMAIDSKTCIHMNKSGKKGWVKIYYNSVDHFDSIYKLLTEKGR
ncbi:ParB/RepB/Spo0J family partition protein [Elusimicrobiota bacterium]